MVNELGVHSEKGVFLTHKEYNILIYYLINPPIISRKVPYTQSPGLV